MPPIVLLTDFGSLDTYVGVMKGVIAGIAPEAPILDLLHEIPLGDVRLGALLLDASLDAFPPGSVFCCVVDPGVGTSRRALAARVGPYTLVGPDNGLLSLAWARLTPARVFEIAERRYLRERVSRTFHGRDVFAPVAARIAGGLEIEALGPRVEDPVELRLPEPRPEAGGWRGEILRIDRFGNAITNLDAALARPGVRLRVAEHAFPLRETYGEASPGEPLALVGSSDRIELALNGENAVRRLGLRIGDAVLLEIDP
jgi:hypothetical protein